MRKYIFISILLIMSLLNCSINAKITSSSAKETSLLNISNNILNALKNKDMNFIKDYVGAKGVRFSHSTYVNVDRDVVLTKNEIANAFNSNKIYLWGVSDGKGENINLNFSDYYKKYIYDKDFLNADLIGNDVFIGTCNTINNAKQVYVNSKIIEYHFKGFDPQVAGIDWESLRLVFENQNNNWYLVGIIHAQWTV